MEIVGTNGGAFCKDFGSVLLKGVVGTITVDYSISYLMRTDNLSETYTADADGQIRINDLGELALCYFDNLPVVLDASEVAYTTTDYQVKIEANIYNSDGELQTTFAQKFFYSNCRTNIDEPYKYAGFLGRHRRCKVRTEQSVNVGYFNRGQSLFLGIAYKGQWIELAYPALIQDGYLHVRNLNVATVLAKLKADTKDDTLTLDDISYYIAYLKLEGSVVDAIQFDVDRRYFPALTHFVYYNCFGVPDTLYFTGRDERSSEMDATFAKLQRKYRKINTGYNIYHGVNTGFITETLRDCVEDLVNSDTVYLYDSSGLGEQITVTEVDFQESRPHTEPINIKLTYRLADECQRRCDRDPEINYRIFDHTFGNTFE